MKKKQIVVGLFPFDAIGNKYIDLIKSSFLMLNVKVVPYTRSGRYDYIFFNWYEVADWKLSFKRLLSLMMFALRGTKIVWTLHNREPHDEKHYYSSLMLMKALMVLSHRIVIHSLETLNHIEYSFIKRKTIYVPHPNYIGEYGEMVEVSSLNNRVLKMLFLGQVRKYKGVDLLVDIVRELNSEAVNLKICGMAPADYGQYIKRSAGDCPNIEIDLKFVEDEEIAALIASHHILVFPYDLKSSLNSGSVILSFSYGRTVLSSMNGTLAGFSDKSMFFSYSYSDYKEHRERLKEMIISIINSYTGRFDDLLDLGARCREAVYKENSIENCAKSLNNIFK